MPWSAAGAKPQPAPSRTRSSKKPTPLPVRPRSVSPRIEEYRAAGCTNIMLEIWGDDREQQAQLFGEAVLPKVK